MALAAFAVRGGQRCSSLSRSAPLWSTASRAISTSAEWRKEEESPGSSASNHGGQHFRTNLQHHPMYSELPKPDYDVQKKSPNSGAAAADGAGGQAGGQAGMVAEEKYEDYVLPHLIWGKNEAESVTITHHEPADKTEKLAYYTVRLLRFGFDILSGYQFGNMNEIKWLRRIIFLETVAGVPGMMGAMARHLQSLRRFERDHGWIHTLLEEAENERMHLLTALEMRKPGNLFRFNVLLLQGIFTNIFFVAYLVSPRFCHRFVGYLEEDAVKTYTHCLAEIDSGHLKMWCKMPAPPIAVNYWRLGEGAMMRDVILAIRADEAHHRLVNHTLGGLKPDQKNPFGPGE
eukprot:scpid33022/ scgid19345/ Alternative oxidase, mitochondrial